MSGGDRRGSVLVIGASGFIGGRTLDTLRAGGAAAIGTCHTRAYEGLVALDATDARQTRALIAELRPSAVVFAAGEPRVDLCELDPILSLRKNCLAVYHVADACRAEGARLVLLSTNAVFGEGDHADSDAPAPINRYGQDKRAAEVCALTLVPATTVVRTANVYGWDPDGHNYLMQVVRALDRGETVRAPIDQIGAPTHVEDVAAALAAAALSPPDARCVHASGSVVVCRYDFARDIAVAFGADLARVAPCRVADLNRAAPQARRCVLLPSAYRPSLYHDRLRGCAAAAALTRPIGDAP